MKRAYTVREIDELRRACSTKWNFGTMYPGNGIFGRPHGPGEDSVGIEEMVRTYMLAGITANDMYKSEQTKTR